MAQAQKERIILALDALVLVLSLLSIFLRTWVFLYIALVPILVILWLQGALRFARLRRWTVEAARGIGQLVRGRRPSWAAIRNLAIAAGIILLIVIVDALELALPGKGRGLSVPTSGLNFEGSFDSPGAALATTLSYALLIGALTAFWFRVWKPLAEHPDSRRRLAYFACLGVFLLALPLYFILILYVQFDNPQESAKFDRAAMPPFLVAMSLAVTLAIALPYFPLRPSAATPTEPTRASVSSR